MVQAADVQHTQVKHSVHLDIYKAVGRAAGFAEILGLKSLASILKTVALSQLQPDHVTNQRPLK